MKRDAAQASLQRDRDRDDARGVRLRPKDFAGYWVKNLPPEGLGDGITAACFTIPHDGLVDDLKQFIARELTNPHFYLPMRAFRLTQNGEDKPPVTKLSAIDTTDLLTFEWVEPYSSENYPRLEYRP
ncbi:unnamed protein product [Symbiodinium sp. CCMP2592]|nr:unnamed protein product [Symbiodinium sp. CCMP2592]